MVETPKLVYLIILFLSTFLFTTSPFSQIMFSDCKIDNDCPNFQRANIRYRKGQCVRI